MTYYICDDVVCNDIIIIACDNVLCVYMYMYGWVIRALCEYGLHSKYTYSCTVVSLCGCQT